MAVHDEINDKGYSEIFGHRSEELGPGRTMDI